MFDPLEAQKAELKKIALHDCLTGLPNRALFRELIHAAVVGAARDGSRLALLFIDIDRFEAVNAALGTRPATRCWWHWPNARGRR